jgi:transposase-like protein
MASKELTLKSLLRNPKKTFRKFRWGKNPITCTKCGSTNVYTKGDIHFCRDCGGHFTDTSNTVFHSSKLPLEKIILGVYYFVTNTRGISSYQLGQKLDITQKSAWILLTKLRVAVQQDLQLSDNVILDELYLGGSFRWKPLHKKLPPNIYHNYKDYTPQELKQRIFEYASQCKMPVLGVVGMEKNTYKRVSVRLLYISTSVSRKNVQDLLKGKIDPSRIISDEAPMYETISKSYGVPHSVNNHSEYTYQSTDGYSSTRVEGLFSQVRRMFSGTYTWCSRTHIQKYLDECAFRYNCRKYSVVQRLNLFFSFL